MTGRQDDVQTYADQLRAALARQGMPAHETEQVVAEVEAHVRDTGEGPVEAFGPARIYAAQYAEGPVAPSAAGPGPGDGIPVWVKVLVVVVAVLALPLTVPVLLAPLLAATGGATALEAALWLLVPLAAGLAAWFAVRRYLRRPSASTTGAVVVGTATVTLAVLVLAVVATVGVWQATSSTSCTMVDGSQSCTTGPAGDNPLVPHGPELLVLGIPALVVAAGLGMALRAALGGRRRR